ncbi:MAG: TetR/AcrR family transcriptional regulator [Gemmatimonadetes bacterium]|nr:TetR/AcrR family transcriptional regulator [Gemmatimonadota bacterium]NNF37664.1 TetR/AcrR family transcriptional regulator [Gemmatimonadota bacterium]
MPRRLKQDWIEEGFRVLAGEGGAGLTVDALCERMDRSKGSFYHHFEGRPRYIEELLTTWETRATDRFVEIAHAGGPVEDRFRSVNREASELRNATVERAIRSWASAEPLARRAQDRVDRRRLELLQELCAERMNGGGGSETLARVFQLVFVGAQHLDPPLEGPELYDAFRFLEPLFTRGEAR